VAVSRVVRIESYVERVSRESRDKSKAGATAENDHTDGVAETEWR